MLKVSVVITTYNSEKSIAKTIASVLSQDGIGKLFTIELIVVDDCSTDSTVDILKACNINAYTTSSNSGGPNKGRNIGLQMATGDYICFLDHDDSWEPQKVRLQLEATKLAPIVTCGYGVTNSFTGHQSVVGESNGEPKVFNANETFLKKLSREKRSIQHVYLSTLMIRKDLKEILFEEHFGMLDYDWLLRLFENRSSVEIPFKLVSRFVDQENLSLNYEYRKRDYYYSLMCLESYQKKYPKEVALAMRRINGSRARYCYLIGEMQEARKFLVRAMPGVKELFYYITTFIGSSWVKRHFVIFG